MSDLEKVPKFRKVSLQEMEDNLIEYRYRDECAYLLIPLNACRRATGFAPWKCVDLRHAFEKCQYDRYQTRVKAKLADTLKK
mmetsp:Transcript_8744/g.17035  ORF Transcript_8744/g.17035 Transcript_8744/m.17035 type:complete len:82 (-) Transcript_8744:159-404(-)